MGVWPFACDPSDVTLAQVFLLNAALQEPRQESDRIPPAKWREVKKRLLSRKMKQRAERNNTSNGN